MNNSARKGGAVPTMQTLHTSPGLEDIWQLHWAYAAGLEFNAPSLFIANVEEPATMANLLLNPSGTFGQGRGAGPGAAPSPAAGTVPNAAAGGAPGAGAPSPSGRGGGGGRGGHAGPAFLIKVSAQADGSFTVTNTRNNFSKGYAASK
jgi:hypothetical protein